MVEKDFNELALEVGFTEAKRKIKKEKKDSEFAEYFTHEESCRCKLCNKYKMRALLELKQLKIRQKKEEELKEKERMFIKKHEIKQSPLEAAYEIGLKQWCKAYAAERDEAMEQAKQLKKTK